MLDEKARKNIFNCWAEKVEDDGKEGKVLLCSGKKVLVYVGNFSGYLGSVS